jgi:predicted lactoylglutathione lyase
MTVPARVNLVTLGVRDVARATAFYTAIGWSKSSASQDEVSFFQLGPVVLSLFGHDALADDAGMPTSAPAAFRGMSLALTLATDADVDATLAAAVDAGATLVKPGQKVFWGGYSGYFADPDGHLWEVAHNPHWTLRADGVIELPSE